MFEWFFNLFRKKPAKREAPKETAHINNHTVDTSPARRVTIPTETKSENAADSFMTDVLTGYTAMSLLNGDNAAAGVPDTKFEGGGGESGGGGASDSWDDSPCSSDSGGFDGGESNCGGCGGDD